MRRLFTRASLIALLGGALGLAVNFTSPYGLPLVNPPPKIPQPEAFLPLMRAKELWEEGATLFLDAREPGDYAAGHIGNALNLPAQSFDQHFGRVAPMLTPGSAMVLYCDGAECELSHHLQESLRRAGFTNTHILFNGWTTWRQAGLPIAQGGSQ